MLALGQDGADAALLAAKQVRAAPASLAGVPSLSTGGLFHWPPSDRAACHPVRSRCASCLASPSSGGLVHCDYQTGPHANPPTPTLTHSPPPPPPPAGGTLRGGLSSGAAAGGHRGAADCAAPGGGGGGGDSGALPARLHAAAPHGGWERGSARSGGSACNVQGPRGAGSMRVAGAGRHASLLAPSWPSGSAASLRPWLVAGSLTLARPSALQVRTSGPAAGNGYEIILQGFNWESSKEPWYKKLASQVCVCGGEGPGGGAAAAGCRSLQCCILRLHGPAVLASVKSAAPQGRPDAGMMICTRASVGRTGAALCLHRRACSDEHRAYFLLPHY